MKRKRTRKFKKADAILTADIELRNYTPICRTDDHWAAQERKITWLRELVEKHDCPILDAGDLFDKKYKSHPSNRLTRWAGYNLPQPFITIPGNHDLPGKSYENYNDSAMAVLEMARVVEHIAGSHYLGMFDNGKEYGAFVHGFEWGYNFKHSKSIRYASGNRVALVHAMVYEEFEPFPGCEGHSAKEMMYLLPDFDLIVCGHNHQTFTRKESDRVLVNPGSLMRNDADQIDFKPSVFLWYAEENKVERVFVPIEKGVINRDHIDIKKKKENRLDAFVEKLGKQVSLGIDFQENLEKAVAGMGKISQNVENKIWEYYEGI